MARLGLVAKARLWHLSPPAAKTDAGRALVGSSEIWHAEPTTTITTGRRPRTIHSFVQREPDKWEARTLHVRLEKESPPPDLTFGGCRTTWTCNTIEDNH